MRFVKLTSLLLIFILSGCKQMEEDSSPIIHSNFSNKQSSTNEYVDMIVTTSHDSTTEIISEKNTPITSDSIGIPHSNEIEASEDVKDTKKSHNISFSSALNGIEHIPSQNYKSEDTLDTASDFDSETLDSTETENTIECTENEYEIYYSEPIYIEEEITFTDEGELLDPSGQVPTTEVGNIYDDGHFIYVELKPTEE